ncbi:MAG: DUF4394 domain-containing protein [Azoarcus sp.]|nr:DUF4394 domain-containing protein [Azoarcus sp.]
MHKKRTLAALTLFAASVASVFAAPLDARTEVEAALGRITLHAVTDAHTLISFNPGSPEKLTNTVALTGLERDEHILGIDYRVARGVMFALGSSGRIFTVDLATGALTPVGTTRFDIPLDGKQFGFDFNPAADRIRIVADSRQNLRAHPETGAIVDARPDEPGLQPDGTLAYVEGDINAARMPKIVAAGYTYNNEDEKLTTNFAIDIATGALVRQGSVEGVQPVVSPNTGKLGTVGSLGVADITDAHLDISDVSNTTLAAISTAAGPGYRLYQLDLATGKATELGRIGNGEALRGIAIEP